MNPQFLLWLTGAMAIFIGGATASRAYIANNNILVLILALCLYCVGNLMMVRLMREGGLGLAISASAIAQLVVVNIVAFIVFGERLRHAAASRRRARHCRDGADAVSHGRRGVTMEEQKFFEHKFVPVTTIVLAILVLWYAFAIILNTPFQRDLDRRANVTSTTMEFIGKTLAQPKPILPAPHQVAQNVFENTFLREPRPATAASFTTPG